MESCNFVNFYVSLFDQVDLCGEEGEWLHTSLCNVGELGDAIVLCYDEGLVGVELGEDVCIDLKLKKDNWVNLLLQGVLGTL